MRGLSVLVFFALVSFQGSCQKTKPLPSLLPTESIDAGKEGNKASNKPKRRKISLIYVKNADRILYGNPCAINHTHAMGFEYIVEPKRLGGSKSKTGKFLNNLAVKSKLVFTRSPFWKAVLNSRFRKCRKTTGDLVGP